ncbi:MAG: LytTR family transcriptional regulator DNA-binding domain-containing protein [Ignavibacterium sp.]|nr:LytTR family transcriptional regulator DNA-binding domain-containing protein [Ignavibacterium sp.]MDW8374580.1 LytTR family transcriptional regulator DNA-binding domain-containing protein [Ignavibacteriales bacterium]
MNKKIKVIIIDDEVLARQIIKNYLSKHSEIEIIAECSDGFDAVKKINQLKPDLIFLDIQMPKITGFEMLELIENPPQIIFTTAYDQFAIRAFEVNAVDYLLKPFSEDRFNFSLEKAIVRLNDPSNQEKEIKNILNITDEKTEILERVIIKDGSKINVIPVDEILYIEAQDDYVLINSEKGKFLKQKTMKYFENHLNENQFVRVHRSFIVNLNFIEHLFQTETESHRLVLKNGKEIPVSKNGLQKLKNIL